MGRALTVIVIFGLALFLIWGFGETDQESGSPQSSNEETVNNKAPRNLNATEKEDRMSGSFETTNRKPQSMGGVLQFFKESYGGEWKTTTSQDGIVTAVMGGNIPDVGSSNDRVLQWGKQVASIFNAAPEQIATVEVASESEFARHLYLSQKVGLFDVYNGGLQVSVRQDDDSIFQINNSLREVGVFDRNIQFNQAQAWQIAKNIFREEVKRVDENAQPVVYSERGADSTELAWVFHVEVKSGTYDEREVVIGAKTGKVLENIPLLVH